MKNDRFRENFKKYQRRAQCSVSAIALLTIPALAQDDAGQENGEAQGDEAIDEVVVTGYRSSLEHALKIKRDSDQIIEALTAEDIGKLPDNNIAEALQRLTGVNVGFTPGGEGGAAFVRGIQTAPGVSPVRVELNGNGTSAGDRSASIANLPASLVSGIEVFKSPAADHVEGGLAGTIRLKTRNPSRQKGYTASVTGRGTYYNYGEDLSPFVTAFIGNAWKTDGGQRLGFILTGSYTDYSLRHERVGAGRNVGLRWRGHNNHRLDIDGDGNAGESVGSAAAPNADDAIMMPSSFVHDTETRNIERGFVNASIGYEPTPELKLTFESIYTFFNRRRDIDDLRLLGVHSRRQTSGDFEFTQYDGVTMYDADSDSFVAVPTFVRGTLDNITTRSIGRRNTTDEDTLNFTGKAEWTRDAWDVEFSFAYVKGTTDFHSNHSDFEARNIATGGSFAPDVYFDFDVSAAIPTAEFVDFDPTDPASWRVRQIGLDARRDEAVKKVAGLDFDYSLNEGFIRRLEFGYRYNQQSLNRVRNTRTLASGFANKNVSVAELPDLYNLTYSDGNEHLRDIDGNIARNWIVPSVPFGAQSSFSDQFGDIPLNLNGSYDITESVHAGYLMAAFGRQDSLVTGNIGVRLVNTATESNGFQTTPGGSLAPFTVNNSYTNLLPSLNLSIRFNEELKGRFAAFKTMVRPALNQLRSNQALDFDSGGELSGGSAGNPNLTAQTANGLDAALEWYFSEGSLLSAGVFYREVFNGINNTPIPYVDPDTGEIVQEPIDPGNPTAPRDPILVRTPVNQEGTQKITGFEAAFQHHFGFLPGWLNGFGTTMNYTYVHSSIDDDPDTPYEDFFTNITPHNFNVALYYDRGKFQSRLAVSWRGETVKGFFPLRAPEYQRIVSGALNRWDFSMSYDLSDSTQVNFLWKNINNFQRQLWQEVPQQFGLITDDESQISIGFRHKF